LRKNSIIDQQERDCFGTLSLSELLKFRQLDFCHHNLSLAVLRVVFTRNMEISGQEINTYKPFYNYINIDLYRGFASCFLRLRVFHTAVRYGKRHVKLIETSAEERGIWLRGSRLNTIN
jgi:hypothetical protein